MPIQQRARRLASALALRSLTPDQLRSILVLSAQDRCLRDLHDVATIISNTGLRPGELCRLRWADIDVHERKLVVNGKTGYRRFVPFGLETLWILEGRRECDPEAEYVLGKSPRRLLDRVHRQLRTVCEGIGLGGVTLRVLRYTFFADLAASGASIAVLLAFGG